MLLRSSFYVHNYLCIAVVVVQGKVSRVYSFSGTNVPGNERSLERKFHHGNECSRERIVLRTNVPDTELLPLQTLQCRRPTDNRAQMCSLKYFQCKPVTFYYGDHSAYPLGHANAQYLTRGGPAATLSQKLQSSNFIDC